MKIAGIELPRDIAEAVAACRPHFAAAAVFSFFINLLFLAPAIVHAAGLRPGRVDRRQDHLVVHHARAGHFAPCAFGTGCGSQPADDPGQHAAGCPARTQDPEADDGVAIRMLRCRRCATSKPSVRPSPARSSGAMFDVPWFPLFLLVAFLMHFWLGILAVVSSRSCSSSPGGTSARRLRRCRRQRRRWPRRSGRADGRAQQRHRSSARHGRQRWSIASSTSGPSASSRLADAQFSGGRFSATSRFLRMFVQSAALGLGALLAIAGYISVRRDCCRIDPARVARCSRSRR